MTRKLVYSGALAAFLAAFAMTLASISIPRWISWNLTGTDGSPIHVTYGLHQRCSTLTGECDAFPAARDCLDSDRYFCSMWRSVGFLMSFTVVLQGMALVAFFLVLMGGKQRRTRGWRVLSAILVLVALVEAGAMAMVAYLFDHEPRFFTGWSLDTSFVLCTASWSLLLMTAVGLTASALVLPEEAGYELVPEAEPHEA